MKPACRRFRAALLEGVELREDHASGCAGCARFSGGLAGYREALRARHAGVTASADFAARLRPLVAREDASGLSWAAWRLVPAGVALVLLLSIWAARTPSPLEMTPESQFDDLLAWTVSGPEDAP